MRSTSLFAAAFLSTGISFSVSAFAGETKNVPLSSLDLKLMQQSWSSPKVDRSVVDHPLMIDKQKFEHGVGSHSDSRFYIAVNGATRFTATVGVDDDVELPGVARFEVIGDGRKLFDSGMLKSGEAGKKIDVSLKDVKTIALIALSGPDGINYSHADWADASFDVDGKSPKAIEFPAEKAEVLTPAAPHEPRINSATVFGVRPNSPILFTVAATGDRPMEFKANNLPEGATFDAATGRLGGVVKKAGTYVIQFQANNARGSTARELKLVVGDQLALTPPMGWNSWNCFANAVDEGKVKAAADAMVSSGLIDHGWTYVNVDDFWQQSPGEMKKDATLGGPGRDANGNIVPNPRFPDMKALADYVHDKGLRFGVYSSPGPLTCGGCLGSFDHEAADAETYAKWGVDYLKYDWCSYNPNLEPKRTRQYKYEGNGKVHGQQLIDFARPYALMGDELHKQPRDIIYSLCQYGWGDVWNWGNTVGGNLWRSTGDINDSWSSLSSIAFGEDQRQGIAGPGRWSDPDMLIVGKVGWGNLHPTHLTPNEQYMHISMWAIASAPMLIGCDMSQLDAFTLGLLTNDEVIAVNQDPLGKHAKRFEHENETEVWSKELADGSIAVALFNRGEMEQTVDVRWSELGISGQQTVRDIWRQKDVTSSSSGYSVTVGRHGVSLLRLSKS